jgi:hypothetical protein
MSTINSEAFSQLTSAINSLLPDFNGVHPQPALYIMPTKITPVGLGGVVGSNNNYLEDIIGRYIEATVTVAAKAEGAASLSAVIAEVSSAFLCSVRQKIMNLEILRMIAEETGPTVGDQLFDADGNFEKTLTFKVSCEFLKTQGPVEPGGIINTIPLDMGLNATDNTPKILISEQFTEHSMDGFDIIDDPQAQTAGPSHWQYTPETFRIEQLSRIRGGQNTPVNAKKPGTYLVLRNKAPQLKGDNFIITSTIRSEASGGIGLVFKWQNVNNFYFFLMDNRQNYRLMAKKLDGVFAFFDTPASDVGKGYLNSKDYNIKIHVRNANLNVYLDNELILQGRDSSIAPLGQIGLLSRDNLKACFYQLGLVQL